MLCTPSYVQHVYEIFPFKSHNDDVMIRNSTTEGMRVTRCEIWDSIIFGIARPALAHLQSRNYESNYTVSYAIHYTANK